MRAIVIGAGRGSRLGPETDRIPKTLVPVAGRPMLDWILEALAAAGIARRDVVFIAGYAEEVVRARYPELTFVSNREWATNNILASLICARDRMKEGFLATYADIVYEAGVVERLLASPHAITLGCDTEWRRRYAGRSLHPESDAEKLIASGERVIRIGRQVPSEQASGEFIGVMRLDRTGAASFLDAFDRARAAHAGRVFREGRPFEKAYLIDLLQQMLEEQIAIHRVDTRGGYMEIDTREDLAQAEGWWRAWQNQSGSAR